MVVELPHLKQLASNTFGFLQRPASFERCFSSASLTASELRTQLSGKHFEPLNVMPCDEVLL